MFGGANNYKLAKSALAQGPSRVLMGALVMSVEGNSWEINCMFIIIIIIICYIYIALF